MDPDPSIDKSFHNAGDENLFKLQLVANGSSQSLGFKPPEWRLILPGEPEIRVQSTTVGIPPQGMQQTDPLQRPPSACKAVSKPDDQEASMWAPATGLF